MNTNFLEALRDEDGAQRPQRLTGRARPLGLLEHTYAGAQGRGALPVEVAGGLPVPHGRQGVRGIGAGGTQGHTAGESPEPDPVHFTHAAVHLLGGEPRRDRAAAPSQHGGHPVRGEGERRLHAGGRGAVPHARGRPDPHAQLDLARAPQRVRRAHRLARRPGRPAHQRAECALLRQLRQGHPGRDPGRRRRADALRLRPAAGRHPFAGPGPAVPLPLGGHRRLPPQHRRCRGGSLRRPPDSLHQPGHRRLHAGDPVLRGATAETGLGHRHPPAHQHRVVPRVPGPRAGPRWARASWNGSRATRS